MRRLRCIPPHTLRPWPLPRASSPMIEELRGQLEQADDSERDGIVEGFHARLATIGTPLVEEDEGEGWCLVTFVWFGHAPHGVVVQLNRITDPLDVGDTLLEPVAGADVHVLTLRLPDDWFGSYLFVPLPQRVPPTLHAPVDMRVMGAVAQFAQADPLAKERIPSKATVASAGRSIPEYAVARGSAAPETALWRDDPAPATALPSVLSPASGATLGLWHHALPGADDDAPVILLADGEVWREQFPIAAELGRRCQRGQFRAAHLLFLGSGGPIQRELDYTGAPEETEALLEVVRKAAAGVASDVPWVVAGQSLGGLFAMLTATRHPERVRAGVAQSPSLWWPTPATPWERTAGWFEERAANVGAGAPILLEAGAIDAGVVERCRSAAALLRTEGSLIDYREYRAGHDILQWQATLADALTDAIRSTA